MATIVGRPSGSATPFNSVADAVAAVGGVEDEYLFEGTATQYQVAGGGRGYPIDGRWSLEHMKDAPFRSRMLVVRPGDPGTFNGTVIVVWNNVTRGHDSVVDPGAAAQLIRDGFAIVGITTQAVGVNGNQPLELPDDYDEDWRDGPTGLRGEDAERYGTLVHPGDGFSYDIYTQGAELVAPERPRDHDPLAGLDVRRMISVGSSQSASRLATYYNAVGPIAGLFDAYLLVVYGGCPCVLDPATAPASLPQIPANPVELMDWRTYLLRDDLDVPLIVLNSELEAEFCTPNTQPDSEWIRTWEIAGTAHLGAGSALDMAAGTPGINQLSYAPVYRAAIHALQDWMDGIEPAGQPRLAKVGTPPKLPRDEHGNALGGIRWPDIEAPIGTHVGECSPDGFVSLVGSSKGFSPEKVRALYGDQATWLQQYSAAVDSLVATGVVLPDDAEDMKADAAMRDLGI